MLSWLSFSILFRLLFFINMICAEISFLKLLKTNEQTVNVSTPQTFVNMSVNLNETGTELNEIRFWYAKLVKSINKILALKERIAKFNKKHHFMIKYLQYMEDHQKEAAVSIQGLPTVPSQDLYGVFQRISLQMQIHIRSSDIVSIWQTPVSNTSLNQLNHTSHPVIVRFKTRAYKNKYIDKVKKLFRSSDKVKKAGYEVKLLGKIFNVFINDCYHFELANFLKKSSSLAARLGFSCYVNRSCVFFRRSKTDRFVITNENQLDLLKRNKYANITDGDTYQSNIQFDKFNPLVYKKLMTLH